MRQEKGQLNCWPWSEFLSPNLVSKPIPMNYQADKDNGLLLLIALAERRLRIEVGYGLEGVLTDAFCGRVIDNTIVPYFKKE